MEKNLLAHSEFAVNADWFAFAANSAVGWCDSDVSHYFLLFDNAVGFWPAAVGRLPPNLLSDVTTLRDW